MKIAFIVQCHKNPQQLNILFKQLQNFDCDIYVHIDKNSENIDSQLDSFSNLFIIPFEERVKVGWGDISQVNATLKLIDLVLDSGHEYNYVWLISGQDFPIKSATEISRFLEINKGTAFIDIKPTNNRRYERLLKRNLVLHTAWLTKKGFIRRIVRNVWYMITGGRYKTFNFFRRKIDSDIFYFGSSWWCLPFQAIIQMKQALVDNPDFHRFYKHCHCPDESFFQTLLMNHTSFNDKIRSNLVFIDWTGCKDSPRILMSKYYDEYLSLWGGESNYMFARKFDFSVDKDIIYKIQKMIDNEALIQND